MDSDVPEERWNKFKHFKLKIMLQQTNKIFMLSAAFISVAAGYHFLGMFYNLDHLPLWRHLTFLIIDIFCVYGLIKRPGYFILFFILFTIQQFFSHGQYLIERLQVHHAIHWNSVLVLVILPV